MKSNGTAKKNLSVGYTCARWATSGITATAVRGLKSLIRKANRFILKILNTKQCRSTNSRLCCVNAAGINVNNGTPSQFFWGKCSIKKNLLLLVNLLRSQIIMTEKFSLEHRT
jgi:hypothetical protein